MNKKNWNVHFTWNENFVKRICSQFLNTLNQIDLKENVMRIEKIKCMMKREGKKGRLECLSMLFR